MKEWSKQTLLDNEELHCISWLVMPKILDIYAYINYWRYIYTSLCKYVCICIYVHLETSGRTWYLVLGMYRKRKKKCLKMNLR